MAKVKGLRGAQRTSSNSVNVRDYVTPSEVAELIRQARRQGRHWKRNAALIGIMFRHGLPVSEAVALQWSDVDWHENTLTVRRAKQGISGVHPFYGADRRALRPLERVSESPLK